jgi:hypothetical protein
VWISWEGARRNFGGDDSVLHFGRGLGYVTSLPKFVKYTLEVYISVYTNFTLSSR